MTRQTVIAYWLIPTEPAYTYFQAIINDLARRYDAPVFEPHLTIHVGPNRADVARRTLSDAAPRLKPIPLDSLRIDHSEKFIKTLFVEFAITTQLRQISRMIRQDAHNSSPYELHPHLSLLYKKMAAASRRELAASIALQFCEVMFGGIKAVRCVSPLRSRADVEAWRVAAAVSFPV